MASRSASATQAERPHSHAPPQRSTASRDAAVRSLSAANTVSASAAVSSQPLRPVRSASRPTKGSAAAVTSADRP